MPHTTALTYNANNGDPTMRPPKDAYGRPQPGGSRQKPAYESPFSPRPAYGQPTTPPKQQKQAPAQQTGNVKGDVIWALRNAGGGMSIHDIVTKITTAGKPRYAETKVQNILEILVRDGKVKQGEETGRVTYKWAVEAI
jgi:hypothetical protein